MISDKQSIAELFKNHFVRLAEGVTQLDTEDYCEDFRDHPSINAIHENSTGSVFKIQNTNSIQIKNLILGINTRKSCGVRHNTATPREGISRCYRPAAGQYH